MEQNMQLPSKIDHNDPDVKSVAPHVQLILDNIIRVFFFLSVDPGIQNHGSVFACVIEDTRKPNQVTVLLDEERSSTVELIKDDLIKIPEELTKSVQRWIWRTFTNSALLSDTSIIVEKQYYKPRDKLSFIGHRLCLIQQTIDAVLRSSYKCNVFTYTPNEVKASYGLATGNYSSNKTEAINHVSEQFHIENPRTLDSHRSDCLLLLDFAIRDNFTTKGKKLHISYAWKKSQDIDEYWRSFKIAQQVAPPVINFISDK